MFMVSITKFGQQPIAYDLHQLPIAGTMAHQLGGPDLYRELVELAVPGITPQMGWQDLAIAYAKWRDEPRPVRA
jgi:hypothetical protein